MRTSAYILGLLCVAAIATQATAAETERLYLSGKGKDDPVKWDFMCTQVGGEKGAIQNPDKWSTIGVPSNWELQGFGIYTYGTERHPAGWPKVEGKYKRTFTMPPGFVPQVTGIASPSGKRVFLVFEGSMTDTQAYLNGKSVGPVHQGGFYQFRYDVSDLLKSGENLLEVTVTDESANTSVNNAERRGDYWNYGGIFRPVYLEILPWDCISSIAIDAKADGTVSFEATVDGLPLPARFQHIEAEVFDLKGRSAGFRFESGVMGIDTGSHVRLAGRTTIGQPQLWTAETPNLYELELRLVAGGVTVHTVRQKFGFRTIETRPGEGVFLNGKRIMFKGADRHSFWPDSGRCLSEKISRDDIQLMKDMNMNAVRMSHYPPDAHFLDACDELGMYVLDELAGWHQRYDATVGKLVEEMVTRDVNHPSILFWDNGNEGGWNNDLNDDFASWDIQKRAVLHPWELFRGIDTKHYPVYDLLVQKAAGPNPFFPTEMLHGLYDGGAGAGLDDYWKVMLASKVSAGGFIWVLADESLKRVDQGGKLDSHGNQAPDGIVGPYREKEGSFYAIKELWSPLVAGKALSDDIDVRGGLVTRYLPIENRFDFTNAQECRFTWETRQFARPIEQAAGSTLMGEGTAKVIGSIPPHSQGKLAITIGDVDDADILYVHAESPDHRDIASWSYPTRYIHEYRDMPKALAPGSVTTTDQADGIQVTAGKLRLTFDKKSGMLRSAARADQSYSFFNGPRLIAAAPASPAPARGAPAPAAPTPLTSSTPSSTLSTLTQKTDGSDLLITAIYSGPMKSITYRLRPNGWLTVDYAYSLSGPHDFFGIGFDYPEANIKGMRYLGNGPYTVYKNRLAGGTLDVWEKKYNNTMVGDPDDLAPGEKYDYPSFKGYYAGVRWLQLDTTEGPITLLVNQDDLYVQILTPKLPPPNLLMQSGIRFPDSGISLLHAIPPIGNKFNAPGVMGPQSQPTTATGDYKGSISLYFGEIR